MAEKSDPFIIEIEAAMPDGAATIAELDALVDRLQVGGRKSDQFQQAVKRLNADLSAAKAASADAAAALAAGNDQYATLEKVALNAARAVEKAQGKGRFDPRAARSAHEAQVALDAYTETLRGLEGASTAAQAKQNGFAKSLDKVSKLGAHADARNAALSQRLEKLGGAFGRLPGPLGSVGQKLIGSAKSAHEVGVAFGGVELGSIALAAGAALAAVAIVAVTVALVAGTIAATSYAVGMADAARTAALSREAFASLSAETAAGVASFSAVAAETGLADAELVALTKTLRAAEVSAADMPKALRAAALAEAALGKGGASEFIERMRAGELSVDAFAREAEDKLGGVVGKQMRSLTAQATKLKKSWGALFAGVAIEPFLDAVGVLVGVFEKGGPLAEAFGLAVEGAINPIGPLALKAAYAVEAFALGFAIQLVKMYLAVKPALAWLAEFFAFDSRGDALLGLFESIGKVLAVVGALAGVGIAVALGALGAAFALAMVPVASFIAIVYGVVTALTFVLESIATGAVLAYELGADLMMGLVNGIVDTVGAVVRAVSDAVGAAITAAKEVLGIASPSKVFAEIGDYTVEGFTGALDAGAADAQTSMANMVSPGAESSGGSTSPAAAAAASGGGGRNVNASGATFNFYGVAGAEQARDMMVEAFTRLLEDDAASMSGAVPA